MELALTLIEVLSTNQLIRTPEGVAIWLEVQALFPDAIGHADLPEKSHSWKHGDPLHRKDSISLADIMKDAKPKQTSSDGPSESQGTGMWSSQLHFAWGVVFGELYKEFDQPKDGKKKGRRIEFKTFWLQVVDGE